MNRGFFGTWEAWRKVALGIVALFGVLLFVTLYVPLGFVVFGLLLVAPHIWRPVGQMGDPRLGMYIPNTKPYALAMFMTSLKSFGRSLLNPIVLVGMGPPAEDADKGLQPGFTPFTRLSAYWAAFCALILGAIDIPLAAAHVPFWGKENFEPWWIFSYVLSVIGWYVTIQLMTAIFRLRGGWNAQTIAATEPMPATMVHLVREHVLSRETLIKSAIFGAVPAVVIIIVWLSVKWDWWWTVLGALVSLLLTALISASRAAQQSYISDWQYRNERRDFWQGVFSFMKPEHIPTLATTESECPSYEEWEQENDPDDPDTEPYRPLVKIATFGYNSGTTYETYATVARQLASQLDVEACALVPVGIITPEGQEIQGTVGAKGFRVWFTDSDIELPNPLDPQLNIWLRNFAVHALVMPRFADIKGIGRCTFQECRMVTQPSSRRQILEVKLQPGVGVNLTHFLDSIPAIQNALGVPWVRVDRDPDSKGNTIVLFMGEEPSTEGMRYYSPPQTVTRKIAKMNWLYTFNAQKLVGTTGAPELLAKVQATKVVDKLTFRLPDGLSFERIASQLSSLRTTSGNSFMEINLGDDTDLSKMSPVERARAESDKSSKFTVIAAKRDPLEQVFEFGKYQKEILKGREPGVAKIDWSPGVLADDTLGWDSWMNSDAPHLLVAGASGSGKALPPDTPILTPDGFRKLRDLRVGDTVFDLHGQPTKVIDVGPLHTPQCAYELTLDDNSTVTASGGHQWVAEDSEARRRADGGRLLREIVAAATTVDPAEVQRRLAIAADAMEIDSPEGAISERSEDAEGVWVADDSGEAWRPAAWWSPIVDAVNGGQRDYRAPYAPAIAAISPEAWGAILVHGAPLSGSLDLTAMQTPEAVAAIVEGTCAGIGAELTEAGITLRMHRRILGRAIEGCADEAELLARVLEVHADAAASVLIGMLIGGMVDETEGSARALVPASRIALVATAAERLSAAVARADDPSLPEGMAVAAVESAALAGADITEPLNAQAFFSGARFAAGDSGALLTGTHPGLADELLAHGIVARADGDGRLKAADAAFSASVGLAEASSSAHAGWSFVGGWAAASGILLENRYTEMVAAGAAEQAMAAMALFDSVGVPAQIELRGDDLVATAQLPSNFVRMSQSGDELRDFIRHEKRYSSRGDRLLTPSELNEATGISAYVIEQVAQAEGITAAGQWVTPGIERDAEQGWTITASKSEQLYPAAAVLRALANTLAAAGDGDAALMVLTTEEMAAGMERGVRYSIPHHVIDPALIPGVDRPVAQHPETLGRRFVTAVKPVPTEPMMCISVDSPTKTYRAGYALVPTHNSVVMSSMILQILFNNGPSEARFWMVEPKNEMQIYRDVDLVERFVDSWTPDDNFIANTADLMEDAVREMDRRNKLFVNHPKGPKQLSKAREIAIRESESAGTPVERHPLYMPFIFIILEECASLFADSASKEEKLEQDRLRVATAEIARKSRSAGIYLICATQYPTNASIPSVIRNQMRRIGMRCQNDLASRVVIEENGLEQIRVKGAGKMMKGDGYRNFRGFWVRDDDPDKPNAQNDIFDVINQLPQNGGQTRATGATMGGATQPRFVVPDISATVFNRFDRKVGQALQQIVDAGKKQTKDLRLADLPSAKDLIPGYGDWAAVNDAAPEPEDDAAAEPEDALA